MDRHVTSVADCRRQGMGLYYNWLSNRQGSTDDVRGIRSGRSRDVITVPDDVTRWYPEFRSDVGMRGRDPAGGRRIRRLDPLINDPDREPQQQQRLPRQRRRRHRLQMTSLTGDDVTGRTPRGFYTSRGVPVTSRAALGDVTTFLTASRDLSRSRDDPVTSSYSRLRRRRNAIDGAWWSKSYGAGNGGEWKVPGLLESPGRMSCFQLELLQEEHNLSLVQVSLNLPVVSRSYCCTQYDRLRHRRWKDF